MVTAKQLGRSALALTLISLSGCQLFQSNTNAEVASSVIVNDHAQSIVVISDQMDMYLSSEGRESFLNQMLVALESDSRDKFKGKDPDTYSWWKIRVQPNEWQQAEIVRPVEEGVDTSNKLEFMDVSYRSKTGLNLRSKPSVESTKLGQLEKGEVFNALARVEGEPWILVEQKGVIKGYVHQDYVRSNVVNRDILSTQPNPLLDAQQATHSVSSVRHELLGSYTCRALSYELTKGGDVTTGSLRACRKKRKVWYIDTPSASPANPS
ncbi:SH3 domain-containing protein [Vibrio parahaemolyticus]|uniref:SH3 domain-containing protein n=1 Tax=Vibrio parahaemolyticus TaxID=670 RepID=UPI001F3F81A0|nr:SH3 domain-containing protein [Vibrio parahaemolyticus]MCG0013063.1 SH3 domain-containing protein [Vibrio parahaemolyticus]MDL1998994.1 SH3 domain-containing protein [Vibrio parahaemolyticus]